MRWSDGKTIGRALPFRRPRGHGEDQAAAHSRLRCRRFSLRAEGRRDRFAVAWSIRRARETESCGIQLQLLARRKKRTEEDIVAARGIAWFHRQRTGRPQPMGNRALDGMATAKTQISLRGAIRSFFRRKIQARDKVLALAPRQRSAAVHLPAIKSTAESRLGGVALRDPALAAYRQDDAADVGGVAAIERSGRQRRRP